MKTRLPYCEAVERLALAEHLRSWPWMLAGTPPLGIDVAGSDIDVICSVGDHAGFADALVEAFGAREDFRIWQWTDHSRAVVCRFVSDDWDFELFGSSQPLAEQAAVRHFEIERRLLARGGVAFTQAIGMARAGGLKTEPAFADRLGLDGNPYDAMLAICDFDDEDLDRLIERAGFRPLERGPRHAR